MQYIQIHVCDIDFISILLLSKFYRTRNEYIKGNLEITNRVGKIRENRLRWFGYVEKRNKDKIVKKMSEMRVKKNQRRARSKKKWMKVIKGDIRTCDVYGNMVKKRKGWKGKRNVWFLIAWDISEDKELDLFYIRKKCELIKQNWK